MQLLKKITMRDLGSDAQLRKVIDDGVSVELAHVAGIARGVKTGVSTYGEWTALTGDFVAQNVETGEEYRSAVCILPGIAQDLVLNALRDADNGVDIAFTIIANPDRVDGKIKVGSRGYKFGARPLIQPKEADEMARLKQLFPTAAQKSLPAATPTPTPAPVAQTPAHKPATTQHPVAAPAKKK